jgi:hypothetical protein
MENTNQDLGHLSKGSEPRPRVILLDYSNQSLGHARQVTAWRRASKKAVESYRGVRGAAEQCFGRLPECER